MSGDSPKEWRHRGIECLDYNNSVVLVRASMDQVAQALLSLYEGLRWDPDVLGREISVGKENLLVFRLAGMDWTLILQGEISQEVACLDESWPCRLSQQLNARVISYGRSDTASWIDYSLFQNGQLLERLDSATDGETRPNVFTSSIRDAAALGLDESTDPNKPIHMVEDFLISEDASEPGIGFEYFLANFKPHSFFFYHPPVGTRLKIRPGPSAFGEIDVIDYVERLDHLAIDRIPAPNPLSPEEALLLLSHPGGEEDEEYTERFRLIDVASGGDLAPPRVFGLNDGRVLWTRWQPAERGTPEGVLENRSSRPVIGEAKIYPTVQAARVFLLSILRRWDHPSLAGAAAATASSAAEGKEDKQVASGAMVVEYEDAWGSVDESEQEWARLLNDPAFGPP